MTLPILLAWLAAAPLTLVKDGKSDYQICISATASPSERRAAAELQRFLFEMSGARLEVVTDERPARGPLILVGRSRALDALGLNIPYPTLGGEGFALKTAPPHLVISGGRLRGTMYGVYEFLEKLGCRWYAHDFSLIPKRPTIELPPLDETGRPAFEYREVHIKEAYGKDWAARNRTNGHFSELDESTGGKLVYQPFVHSFNALVPPEKYFRGHPEYFSLINGQRRVERSQLCLSNPQVLRIATQTVMRWIDENPQATIFSVSQNDNEGWCECGACRRVEAEEGGMHSGPILRFVNAIAAEVGRNHPGKLIDTLAYIWSEQPPARTRPLPNVRIRLAPIGACQGHPYAQCPRNSYYLGNLRAWGKLAPQLYVWHYITNFSHYLLPYPNFDEIIADLPMYHKSGVVGLFLQGAYSDGGGGELAELRAWLLARLLWNPYAGAGALMDEFLKAYYGPAGPKVRQYIEWMQREVRLPPRGLGKPMWVYKPPRFSPEFLPRARELFGEMERAAAGEPFLRRVRKLRLSIEWLEILEAKRFVLDGDRYGPADLAGFRARFRDFVARARAFGITHLHELWTIADTEREYAQYVRLHPVARASSGWLDMLVVPGLHGRIVQLVNRKTGRDALRHPEPDERFSSVEGYGGILLLAHQDVYSRERYDPEWRVASSEGRLLVLEGSSPNGLRFTRRLELDAGAPLLRTHTRVRNAGETPVAVALQSRAEFNPGDRDAPTVDFAYRDAAGRLVTRRLLPPTGQFFGMESFLGAGRPPGEWWLHNRSLGLTLRNRFPLDQVPRLRLWFRGRGENKVNLSLWSDQKTLKPGESLELSADYLVE